MSSEKVLVEESPKEGASSHELTERFERDGFFVLRQALLPQQVQSLRRVCDRLTDEYNIFLTRDGRISMAGITTSNVDYVAGAMHEVSK